MNKKLFLLSVYDLPYEDEDDEILKEFFLAEDIVAVRNSAKNLNLHCLKWISCESITFFNGNQAYEIETKELPILKQDPALNKHLLEHMTKICNAMKKEGHYFMKIEPKSIE